MWACYIGEISESYQKQWEPHTISPDQTEPDVYDVLVTREEIAYRLDMPAAAECFSDCIQVDWGGWAYKVTKAQVEKYNLQAGRYAIPKSVVDGMLDDHVYGIIDVEIY